MSDSRVINRREFFSYVSVGWILLSAACAGLTGLMFRYTYPNVNFDPEMEFIAGKPIDFPPGVDERFKGTYGVWMVNLNGRLVALSDICTHLGCIPNWQPAESKFKCPCHGSGYYMSGVNFEGPAPRPLERFKISLQPDGTIKVDKTKVFRSEKGEWDNPDAFLVIG